MRHVSGVLSGIDLSVCEAGREDKTRYCVYQEVDDRTTVIIMGDLSIFSDEMR